MQDTVGPSQYELGYFPGSSHADSYRWHLFHFLLLFLSYPPPRWNQVTLAKVVKTYEA